MNAPDTIWARQISNLNPKWGGDWDLERTTQDDVEYTLTASVKARLEAADELAAAMTPLADMVIISTEQSQFAANEISSTPRTDAVMAARKTLAAYRAKQDASE